MRDSYVNNVEEILSANESQRNKIEFLQRERLKRDHYLSDLQENLSLNKETLKQYNLMGCNQRAINKLVVQIEILSQKVKEYYEDYQNINAELLMEKQMRLEDRQFYQERVIEFENKLVDLRKYLHDKEESFSSVITRLKRYEEMSQLTTEEKLQGYKKQIGQRSTNQFIADLIKQKNFYKNEYQKMKKDYITFSDMKISIIKKYEDVQSILKNFQKENSVNLRMLVGNVYHKMEEDKKINKKMQPPKELIRLLKKEKLNNQLLEEALNDAIQKNEELVTLKNIFQKNVQRLTVKCNLLYSQNTIFAIKLAEYDQHFCRRHSHNKKYYEEGEIKGLSFIINDRLKEYARNIFQYYETNAKLYQQYNQKLKEDVDKWGQFLCDSHELKKQFMERKLLMKSCSTPKMIVGLDLDEIDGDKLIIEEL